MRDKIIEVMNEYLVAEIDQFGDNCDVLSGTKQDLADKILEVILSSHEVDCCACCHQNDDTLKGWFEKYRDDNGYIKADSIEICPECSGCKVDRTFAPCHKCDAKGWWVDSCG